MTASVFFCITSRPTTTNTAMIARSRAQRSAVCAHAGRVDDVDVEGVEDVEDCEGDDDNDGNEDGESDGIVRP